MRNLPENGDQLLPPQFDQSLPTPDPQKSEHLISAGLWWVILKSYLENDQTSRFMIFANHKNMGCEDDVFRGGVFFGLLLLL